MRWLALLLAAAVPTGAVLAQENGAAGPFGDERQFFFRCEAEVADGPLSASGSMVVDSNGAHAESLVWLSNEPLAFNDYEQESPANLHAFWSEPLGPQAFEAGRLHLMWDAPRRLPRPLLLTVDERLNDGTFAVLMNRYEKRKAAASIRLGHLLRWAGDKDQLRLSVYGDGGSEYLGTAVLPKAIITRMRGQFESLLARLDAKAADFQNQCTRHEHRDDLILAN